MNFVFQDSHEGLILKAKLLNRDMRNSHLSDIQDYLLEIAERDPERVTNLYTGEDMHLRLLLIDALHKKVVIIKNKVYIYSDGIVLGASEDSVLTYFKQPQNAKVLELIKKDVYPEAYDISIPEVKEASDKILASKKSKADQPI